MSSNAELRTTHKNILKRGTLGRISGVLNNNGLDSFTADLTLLQRRNTEISEGREVSGHVLTSIYQFATDNPWSDSSPKDKKNKQKHIKWEKRVKAVFSEAVEQVSDYQSTHDLLDLVIIFAQMLADKYQERDMNDKVDILLKKLLPNDSLHGDFSSSQTDEILLRLDNLAPTLAQAYYDLDTDKKQSLGII